MKALVTVLGNWDLGSADAAGKKTLKNLHDKLKGNSFYELFTDGAADLHSETAGIGGVIYIKGEELYSFSEFIGKATNNEAEYKALIRGLQLLIELGCRNADVFLDSELVVKQVNGDYKVKNDRMKVLNLEVMKLFDELDNWKISHVRREKNTVADKHSKIGMKKGQKKNN